MNNRIYFKHISRITILCISFIILLTSCASSTTSDNSSSPLTKTELLMGTAVTISIYDNKDQAILEKAFNRVRELEDSLSINKSSTLLDEVNRSSGIKPVLVDRDTFTIVKRGLEYSNMTDGSFDITVGPIVKLWNIGLPDARVPSATEIEGKLPLVNYKDIVLDENTSSIYLKNKGMIIDLGGIAKGYTADVIAKLLIDNGVKHAIVDLGGNIYTVGDKLDGSLWKVGIQDPVKPRGSTIGYVTIKDASVVTSGIYERYLEQGGKKYHHILNPATGYPFDNELAGISIISEKSIDGDALSTSVFSKGLKGGLEFINNHENIEALLVTKDKKVYITKKLRDIFTLTDDSFTLMD